jgi:hypothetical protein
VRPYTPLSDALSDLSVLAESVRGSALLSVATSPKLGRRARRLDPPEPVDDLLAFTVAQLSAGVEDIRSLVNGIYPPALATSALGATLTDLARPGGVVDVHTVLNRRSDPSSRRPRGSSPARASPTRSSTLPATAYGSPRVGVFLLLSVMAVYHGYQTTINRACWACTGEPEPGSQAVTPSEPTTPSAAPVANAELWHYALDF